ncbi:MAG: hypothetical protein KKE17_14275, partial [Proteobacteria bacterium]|nr:hypothetical protein [Pseudomonadota bacterium]
GLSPDATRKLHTPCCGGVRLWSILPESILQFTAKEVHFFPSRLFRMQLRNPRIMAAYTD